MATKNRPSVLSNSHVGRLTSEFDELGLGEMLELEDTFTARDINRDRYATKKVLKALRGMGAITVVGDVQVNSQSSSSQSRVNQYRWKPEARDYLRQYKADRSELPCGCRAHVHHTTDGTFGCQYCDDDPEFDRQTIEEAIEA